MGRTSNFSFPLPGRRRVYHGTKGYGEQLGDQEPQLSKAQRVLGTGGDINIDSPTRDEHNHHGLRHISSSMSITISDSTEDEELSRPAASVPGSRPPSQHNHPRLRGKPSSTLLGRRHHDEIGTETSSITERLRNQPSSSTLRSYYDPQKAPLYISQQTSASSARDLALRKGLTPVVPLPRSPLLQVDSLNSGDGRSLRSISHGSQTSGSRETKKKSMRLEIGRLFPNGRREDSSLLSPQEMIRSPSMASTTSGTPQRRKLIKKDSRNRQPKAPNTQPEEHYGLGIRSSDAAALQNLYDHYEHMQQLDSQQLSEAELGFGNVSDNEEQSQDNERDHNSKMASEDQPATVPIQPFSWKNVRASMAGAGVVNGWEAKSIASNSSRNTKASKRSLFSHTDLHTSSVLSLSSEDEDSGEDDRPARIERLTRHNLQLPRVTDQSGHPHQQKINTPKIKINSPKPPSTQPTKQSGTYLTVPMPSPGSLRISGPWGSESSRRSSAATWDEEALPSTAPNPGSRPSLPRRSSESSTASNCNGGRLMAVTKQEEALLEALRQKKARMREKIIAEHEKHETNKASRGPDSKFPRRDDEAVSPATRQETNGRGKERILLYLDRPLSTSQTIDTAEPSPDLSDFLSFGSDEEDDDATPRSSWIPAKDIPRPDSSVGLRSEGRRSPITPKNGLRLSALGPTGVLLQNGEHEHEGVDAGVTYLDAVRHSGQAIVEEEEVIWGM